MQSLRLSSLVALAAALCCNACSDDSRAEHPAKPNVSAPDAGETDPEKDASDPGSADADAAAPESADAATTPPETGDAPNTPAADSGSANKPISGASDFVSAGAMPPPRPPAGATPSRCPTCTGSANTGLSNTVQIKPVPSPGAQSAATARAVERGDIYRVLGDQRLLNLNSHRGLQILNVSNLNQPRIEGQIRLAGEPVELYVVGDRAVVLLNDWIEYYVSAQTAKVESATGSLIASVDIRDRAHPRLIAHTVLDGQIAASRVVQGGGGAALYAASALEDKVVIRSFDLSMEMLTPKSELTVAGALGDMQATTELLTVANNVEKDNVRRAEITLIDISNPDGTMRLTGSVLAQSGVEKPFQVHVHQGILRVVSGSSNRFSNGETHLETFDLSDLSNPLRLDDCSLTTQDPDGLVAPPAATLFMPDRAFVVTFDDSNTLHALAIDETGSCSERLEYRALERNAYLRPVLGNRRFVGIGHESELDLSVSLYDADLNSTQPRLARADIALPESDEDAIWDDRSFSVLEDAVSIQAPDGTTETGMILVAFTRWNDATTQVTGAVQIFTFSDRTLTPRGTMEHGTRVLRSFAVGAGDSGNLSQQRLSLFDLRDPTAPKPLGQADLSPEYRQILIYGDRVVRVRVGSADYSQPPASFGRVGASNDKVQVIDRKADLDGTSVLTSFDISANSRLHQVGKLLVGVDTRVGEGGDGYRSVIQVYDMSVPERPARRATIETDRLEFPYDPDRPADSGTRSFVLGESIAFVTEVEQRQVIGVDHVCKQVGPEGMTCATSGLLPFRCTVPYPYYRGGITCTTPSGGKETCTGEFELCEMDGCKPVAPPPGSTTTCQDVERIRRWMSYRVDTLNLHDPSKPAFDPSMSLPADEEASSVFASGSALYLNHFKPVIMQDDSRNYVKRFVRVLDFSAPGATARGEPINVPGDVIAAEGSTIYTRDRVWTDRQQRTLVARLIMRDSLAHLQTEQLFADRDVLSVAADGVGHILVDSDSPAGSTVDLPAKLSILEAESLSTVSELELGSLNRLRTATRGRALCEVPGGLLIYDVQDPAHPKAQAFFRTSNVPDALFFDGNDILFAAHAYGVYSFDANASNLLTR